MKDMLYFKSKNAYVYMSVRSSVCPSVCPHVYACSSVCLPLYLYNILSVDIKIDVFIYKYTQGRLRHVILGANASFKKPMGGEKSHCKIIKSSKIGEKYLNVGYLRKGSCFSNLRGRPIDISVQ